eukprot:TRINITY_DN47692_c0_g1_i2.p1 TRINITY_DN47692_c0_g1~~TRINITY_DN47692_c0_g1_i2.p1  ORF type:complete len:100 (+),score=16.43 TRINITY_DN47692_c0_g1_i2:33-302(+)
MTSEWRLSIVSSVVVLWMSTALCTANMTSEWRLSIVSSVVVLWMSTALCTANMTSEWRLSIVSSVVVLCVDVYSPLYSQHDIRVEAVYS